jgi:hypothetical protein
MAKIDSTEAIKDMAGYLINAVENKTEYATILFNLSHDILGLARKDKCFLPRTSGYGKFFKKGRRKIWGLI